MIEKYVKKLHEGKSGGNVRKSDFYFFFAF